MLLNNPIVMPMGAGGGSAGGVVVTPSSMTSVGGYSVPNLTSSQVTLLYNTLVAGKSCTVTDVAGNLQFQVLMGDASTGHPAILLQYRWLAQIEYQVNAQDRVVITPHSYYKPAYEITSVSIGADTIDITIT